LRNAREDRDNSRPEAREGAGLAEIGERSAVDAIAATDGSGRDGTKWEAAMGFFRGGMNDPLDEPFLWLDRRHPWTIRDLYSHLLIQGVTGSGKSSGSAKAVAKALLRSPCIAGGMVMCLKNSECDAWLRYHREMRCRKKIAILRPGGEHKLNPFRFEVEHGGSAAQTENLLHFLEESGQVLRRRRQGGSGVDGGEFWQAEGDTLNRVTLDALLLAYGAADVADILKFIVRLPNTPDELGHESFLSGFANQTLKRSFLNAKSPRERHDADRGLDYVTKRFPRMGEKMRSGIVAHAVAHLDVLNAGMLWETMGHETTVSALDCFRDTWLIVDAPPATYGVVGLAMLALAKTHFQSCVARRQVGPDTPGTVLFCDESQMCLTDRDPGFLATCRESRCGVVFVTQTWDSYLAAYEGAQAEAKASVLYSQFATKCIHSLADSRSATAASELLGKHKEMLFSVSSERRPYDPFASDWSETAPGGSAGFQESWQYRLDPSYFTRLRTGGAANGYHVDGVWMQAGKDFGGRGYLDVTFDQRA
jgi:hypothetical protein